MRIPLKVVEAGLYCPLGDFFIDAWRPVPTCIVTHAHGDHAYFGHGKYIVTEHSLPLLKKRLGPQMPLHPVKYGERFKLGSCWVSLHPAGHILGSAQVRIETKSSVTVISGDYKRAEDATCTPFETVECDIFVTESTFALPIYQWPTNALLAAQLQQWWDYNASHGHPSVLFCYSLGKAQRILSLLTNTNDRPIYLHGATFPLTSIYKELDISVGEFLPVSESAKGSSFEKELILAPPSAAGTPWLRRFPHHRSALASGWMQVRGTRRRNALDRGFLISDHADWKGLIQTIEESQAKIVLTTHGNTAVLARYLREELHLDARELKGLEAIENEEIFDII